MPGFHIGDAVIAVSDQQLPHDAGYWVAEAGQPMARIPAGLLVPDIMALTKGAALAMGCV
ncbi:MAG: hypothetical protein HC788_03145 [Sphingopyxis sp.]|nr:hypothetical protein [Sphingopyxis sp.]